MRHLDLIERVDLKPFVLDQYGERYGPFGIGAHMTLAKGAVIWAPEDLKWINGGGGSHYSEEVRRLCRAQPYVRGDDIIGGGGMWNGYKHVPYHLPGHWYQMPVLAHVLTPLTPEPMRRALDVG